MKRRFVFDQQKFAWIPYSSQNIFILVWELIAVIVNS